MRKNVFKLFKRLLFILLPPMAAFAFAENSRLSEETKKLLFDTEYEIDKCASIPLVPFESIPDSSFIRKQAAKTWFLSAPEDIAGLEERLYTDKNGKNFKIRPVTMKDPKQIAVVITPLNTDFSFSCTDTVPQGTWILFRDWESGKPSEIKIYPRENPELYLRLYPGKNEESSFIDVCLFNAYVRKGISALIPFETLYYFSLKDLRALTEDILPWKLFDPPFFYGAVESASDIISERLYKLVYLEDAGFDELGTPIHLKDGRFQTKEEIIGAIKENKDAKKVIGGVNCSGFVKWIVDGIIRPQAGQGIFTDSLKTGTEITESHFNRPYLQSRDLFFGLDWIRNLAAAALSLNENRTIKPAGSGIDVKAEPFAMVPPVKAHGSKKIRSAFKGYSHNTGYQMEYLQAILYYLAITEPGHFYLGAVNRDIGSPPLRQYHHVAAFFPYFDSLGSFHIDVYESAEQSTISAFTKRNEDAFIALTRIRVPEIGLFNP